MSPTDATRPDDPVETPSARTYEQRPVSTPVPGHRSPAPTEPGDLGGDPDGDPGPERNEETPSREGPRAEGGVGDRGG